MPDEPTTPARTDDNQGGTPTSEPTPPAEVPVEVPPVSPVPSEPAEVVPPAPTQTSTFTERGTSPNDSSVGRDEGDSASQVGNLASQRAKARAKIASRKATKLDSIMAEVQKRGKITNDEVQMLVRVSDATATRYLSELKRQGKIKQVGSRKGTFYE